VTDLDDIQIGRLLSRRDVLVLFGASGTAAFLAACTPSALQSLAPTSNPNTAAGASASTSALPACVVEPALTEGPYFVDEKLLRSDIRPDPSSGAVSQGAQLNLAFAVSKVGGSSCQAYPDVLVDVWHCDALGHYSDIASEGTLGQKFLRGYQVTDASGNASFTTIYPGWYQGRTVHIHFKIRSDPAASSGLEFTSQLFFDDTLSDQVFAVAPYSQKGQRSTRNDWDGIFQQSNGVLTLAPSGDPSNGFSATFEVGLQVW
jgi:protocatechuate 3,4-dioxygenase beta subunit